MEKILLIILIIIITIIIILYINYSSNKIDHIIYINLDKRVDRKEQIEGELKKFNLTNYERFSAIENKNGAIGCSKSHLEVIKLAKKRGYKNILVLEDDFQFIVSKEKFNQQINKLSNINFDVCLLAYNTPNLYKSEYPFLYKIKDAQTASGYLIQAHYYDTLIDCWEKAIKLFEETNDDTKYTCDQSWKKLQEKNNWYCFKTRMGKQRESYSDIQKGVVNYNV
jgi:glycosyl transferase family 25